MILDEFLRFIVSEIFICHFSGNIMQNWNLIAGIAIIASPILFSMIAYPDSVAWSWNEGEEDIFLLCFCCCRIIGLKIVISKKRLLAVIPIAIATIGLSYLFRIWFTRLHYRICRTV